ncbi:sulfite exporter TauE/SafE family protein [Aliidiomarina minuta]|uniref:Sulfite exporter TauE/SafE family protein n=1 Tax=Aliidiomarina minuta TaxID=880057 RepID=A0A432W6H8_9GAMM|nr:sulfite exporter TauE/SafE family protein [Aliidiomarina minuta]RUO25684.1 sulfite exporter TauE/SafE family protein [Aliidiomarina minuta]
MQQIDLVSAVLMGLAGSGHCIAMCGGLAGAMGLNQSPWRLLIYNLGRISSYMLAGAILGSAIFAITQVSNQSLIIVRFAAGLMMILLALYITRVWMALAFLERVGAYLWRLIKPLLRYFPANAGAGRLYIAGMLWGWLPCGLVYSALTWAALSGSPQGGALTMLAFGLGTLPSMLIFGVFSRKLSTLVTSAGFRWVAGILLLVYGIMTCAVAVQQWN